MFNSPLLDVAISLTFIYFLMSVLTSGITEFIQSVFQKRGKDLRWAINEAFNDRQNKNWAELMYDHPLIDGLKKTDDSLPSYISSEVFANVLIDVIVNESREVHVDSKTAGEVKYTETFPSGMLDASLPLPEKTYYNFKEGVKKLKPGDVPVMLNNFLAQSKNFDELKNNIKSWYAEYMDRAAGWYKRDLKKWLFTIGMLVAVILNVDSIYLARNIYKNKSMRDAIVRQAEIYTSNNLNADSLRLHAVNFLHQSQTDSFRNIYEQQFREQIAVTKSLYDTMSVMNLPIGWKNYKELVRKIPESQNPDNGSKSEKPGWLEKIFHSFNVIMMNLGTVSLTQFIGWIFTAIAVSFGAPFWFDALNKLVNMRSSGKKPANN